MRAKVVKKFLTFRSERKKSRLPLKAVRPGQLLFYLTFNQNFRIFWLKYPLSFLFSFILLPCQWSRSRKSGRIKFPLYFLLVILTLFCNWKSWVFFDLPKLNSISLTAMIEITSNFFCEIKCNICWKIKKIEKKYNDRFNVSEQGDLSSYSQAAVLCWWS